MSVAPSLLLAAAFVGADDEPLFIESATDTARFHGLCYLALDYITLPTQGTSEAFLGLLVVLDSVAIYGYRTASNVKILLCVDVSPDKMAREIEILTVLKSLQNTWSRYLCNPFLSGTPQTQADFSEQQAAPFLGTVRAILSGG